MGDHFNFGLLNHRVSQFDEFVYFFVLFLEDGFLGVDKSFLGPTLFLANSLYLDVVL